MPEAVAFPMLWLGEYSLWVIRDAARLQKCSAQDLVEFRSEMGQPMVDCRGQRFVVEAIETTGTIKPWWRRPFFGTWHSCKWHLRSLPPFSLAEFQKFLIHEAENRDYPFERREPLHYLANAASFEEISQIICSDVEGDYPAV
jgi:hypothetical protein